VALPFTLKNILRQKKHYGNSNIIFKNTLKKPLKKYLKGKEELRKLKYNFQKYSKKNQNFFKLL
jgi:hypothetical protein